MLCAVSVQQLCAIYTRFTEGKLIMNKRIAHLAVKYHTGGQWIPVSGKYLKAGTPLPLGLNKHQNSAKSIFFKRTKGLRLIVTPLSLMFLFLFLTNGSDHNNNLHRCHVMQINAVNRYLNVHMIKKKKHNEIKSKLYK